MSTFWKPAAIGLFPLFVFLLGWRDLFFFPFVWHYLSMCVVSHSDVLYVCMHSVCTVFDILLQHTPCGTRAVTRTTRNTLQHRLQHILCSLSAPPAVYTPQHTLQHTLQHTHCNTHCNTHSALCPTPYLMLRHTHCTNTLQPTHCHTHTATHTLQHTHCNTHTATCILHAAPSFSSYVLTFCCP